MELFEFFRPDTPLVAIPSWHAPKVCVACWNKGSIWAGSALLPAFKKRARLRRIVRRLAALFAQPVRASSSKWIFEKLLSDAGCANLTPWAMLIGTPGPAQKITVQLRDEQGKVAAYIKYGESVAAKRRLENEWRTLTTLPDGIAPRALGFDYVGQGAALLISAAQGAHISLSVRPHLSLIAYLDSLPQHGSVAGHEHPWLRRLFQNSDVPLSICECLTKRHWPIVTQHGDFAPWNLLRHEGRIIAIDWEYATLKGFPGADLAYYVLQVGRLIKQWKPEIAAEHAVRALMELPSPRFDEREAQALVRLVAFDAYCNALDDGHLAEEPLQKWRWQVSHADY